MLREGVVAGAVAATGVALLYLVVDLLVVGAPLVTQRLLGAGVATLVGLQATFDTAATTVLQYTALHYAAFIAFGVAAAGVVHLARRHAAAIAGALLLFAVAEASFFVAITLLGDASRTGAVMWPQLAARNVVGTLLVGGWLWRRHPELRGEVAEGLGGDTA